MSPSPRRCTRGFTLLELLVALALLGLIATLVFAGLRLGARTWEAVDARAEALAELRAVHGFVGRALRQGRALSLTFEDGVHPVFAGDSERLEWVAPLSTHVGLPGLHLLRLTRERGPRGEVLMLTHWLFHPEVLAGASGTPPWVALADEPPAPGAPGEELDLGEGAFGRTLLLAGPMRFELAYYGTREGEPGPAWHRNWLGQPRPPRLVRMRLRTAALDWPELVVALADEAAR
ncbi:prepilin-type N-terminal cleavage/methylation domain-containing protein [Marichromatium gracile]|uniref:prepilin-type N-terminal cleavage/methylation domain-containing protein n=1 Tax=Marichromatium gracile TaxID=1048 RepID=UPI001F405D49|nr:prepilin-type N-terminal cleavage/methylation domain-containing protein [Marichromatium gracile]MCF1182405.1 prepilin-type N-terminal cleavage/methylation domain-containing protein [Marichromatium gracile]